MRLVMGSVEINRDKSFSPKLFESGTRETPWLLVGGHQREEDMHSKL